MILEWFQRFKPSRSRSKRNGPTRATQEDTSEHEAVADEAHINDSSGGFFTNASDVQIQGSNMFDMHNSQFTQNIVNNIMNGTAALERLLSYTCPDAAVDSSARDPPPRCHPGTRENVTRALQDWLENPNRESKMLWLSGFVGTGKSAVAQTFAEICAGKHRLGAAYFFSRPHKRNDPKTVVPTVAYQLAVHFPDYGTLLASVIGQDPTILQKTPRIQLKRLIVEPFSMLQLQGHPVTRSLPLIILDGLDECRGISAQCEIVEMIGEVVRLKKDLPLLWLICSRPESHFDYLFARTDFSIDCRRKKLPIDERTRDDVDHFLRDSFDEIQAKFPYVTEASWPSPAQSKRVEDIACGLFVLASTIIRYVGDMEYKNPTKRLADFLRFMEKPGQVNTRSPLETLDLLYFQILSDIPDNVWPVTRRILCGCLYPPNPSAIACAQMLCNFLELTKEEFYGALANLHSVLDVPSPDMAVEMSVRMYHASFKDYLETSVRSERFFISPQDSVVEIHRSRLAWYGIVLSPFPDSPYNSHIARKLLETKFKWSSQETCESLSHILEKMVQLCWFDYTDLSHGNKQGLLVRLEEFDFRYIELTIDFFHQFANWLSGLGALNTLLRTKVNNELEESLLDRASLMTNRPMVPAIFPIFQSGPDHLKSSMYFFIGHGVRTCLFQFEAEDQKSFRIARLGRICLSCRIAPEEDFTAHDFVEYSVFPLRAL